MSVMTSNSLQLAGEGGLLQPVFNGANTLIDDFHTQVLGLGAELGLHDLAKSVVNLGGSLGPGDIGQDFSPGDNTNLLTDLLNLPNDVLNGNADTVIPDLGGNLSYSGSAAGDIVDNLVFGGDPLAPTGGDAVNPVPELLSGIGSSLGSNPLLGIGQDNGLLGGTVLDASESASGHLVDVDVGSEQSNGLVLDLLAAPSEPSHGIEVNAIDVGSSGPSLLDANVLGSDGLLSTPDLAGAGTDSLVGNLTHVLGDGLPLDTGSGDGLSGLLATVTDAAGGTTGLGDLSVADLLHGQHSGLL